MSLMIPYGFLHLGHHWFRQWLVTYLSLGNYQNQRWHIFNKTLMNKLWSQNTVWCRYDMVKYVMISHTIPQLQQQNINQYMNSQKTPHTSPSWARYCENFGENWLCCNSIKLYDDYRYHSQNVFENITKCLPYGFDLSVVKSLFLCMQLEHTRLIEGHNSCPCWTIFQQRKCGDHWSVFLNIC